MVSLLEIRRAEDGRGHPYGSLSEIRSPVRMQLFHVATFSRFPRVY